MINNTDILILTGGKGSRIKKRLKDKPKTLVQIGGEYLIDITINYLFNQGFRRFILCTGFYANPLKDHFLNNKMLNNIEIIFSHEETQIGTGGAIKNAEKLVRSKIFFVINGDTFIKLNYAEMLDFHISKKADITLSSGIPKFSGNYRQINVDNNEKIISLGDKNKLSKLQSDAGVYCFNREIIDKMPNKYPFALESYFIKDSFENNLFLYATNKVFIDIGTPERLDKIKIEDFK